MKSKHHTEGRELSCDKYSVAIKVTVYSLNSIVAINNTANNSYRTIFFGSVLKDTDFTLIIHHAKKALKYSHFIVEQSLF